MEAGKIRVLAVCALLLTLLLCFGNVPVYAENGSAKPKTGTNNQYDPKGWAEVIMWGEALTGGPGAWGQGVWEPVQVILPISSIHDDGRGLIQGENVLTIFHGNGVEMAGGFTVTDYMYWLIMWEIDGILYPQDCTLELHINERWFPGFGIACGPFVGCIAEPLPHEFHPDIEVAIPKGTGYGYIDYDKFSSSVSGRFHVFLVSLASPDMACDYNQFMP